MLLRFLSWKRRKQIFPYLLVLPGALAVAVILVYPLAKGILSSFYLEQPLDLGNAQFVGLQHFRTLLNDKIFKMALRNSIVWTITIVAVQYILALFIALLLNQDFPGRSIFRGILLIPWVVPNIAAALTWRWIYADQFGILNHIFVRLGIIGEGISWLGSTDMAFISVIIAAIWKGTPFVAVTLLAGLQSIPHDLYEAALVAGANKLQELWYITLPSIKGVSIVAIILSSIWTFNQFDLVWLMTRGGPANSTQIIPVYTYVNAFNFFKFNYAAAIGTVGVLILSVLGVLSVKNSRAAESDR